MIAKFKCDGGWALHECDKVNTYDDIFLEEVMKGKQSYLVYVKKGQEASHYKRVDIRTQDGWETILFAHEAYLMNDNGNTIGVL